MKKTSHAKHKETPAKETPKPEPKPEVNRIPEIMMNIHRGYNLSKYPDLSAAEKKDLLVALDKESESERIFRYPSREIIRESIRKQLQG